MMWMLPLPRLKAIKRKIEPHTPIGEGFYFLRLLVVGLLSRGDCSNFFSSLPFYLEVLLTKRNGLWRRSLVTKRKRERHTHTRKITP